MNFRYSLFLFKPSQIAGFLCSSSIQHGVIIAWSYYRELKLVLDPAILFIQIEFLNAGIIGGYVREI